MRMLVLDHTGRRASRRLLLVVALAFAAALPAVAQPANPSTAPGSSAAPASGVSATSVAVDAPLRVDLGDGRTMAFTRADLERLPAESASATLRDRPPFTVSGISVTTLLRLAGLDLSASLGSGPVVGKALVARAADGYVAVFGLADVDPHFGHAPLLVVWTREEGRPLPPREGPFMLINTGESRPGRWVRQVIALEVRDIR
jgi:hypothetical protein